MHTMEINIQVRFEKCQLRHVGVALEFFAPMGCYVNETK